MTNGIAMKVSSYHLRLFSLMISFSVVIAVCVIAFQYEREKDFKAELLNSRLQAFNRDFAYDGGADLDAGIRRFGFDELRVTVIDSTGSIVFDNVAGGCERLSGMNHNSRPEVAQAFAHGEGYTVRRHSESTGENYFYSATRVGNQVVRSAVPYSVSLAHVLEADRGILWFMAAITVVMGVAAWFATRRIGHAVTRLNDFARRAEAGEKIYADEAFPKDELGDISKHIVRLYAQRERQHEEALRQERDKIRIKKQLTNNINHELKTPLAAMRVCLETLMSHPELPDETRQMFMKRCWDNSGRLSNLLSDVATLTRLDDGSAVIAREPVSLNAVVDEAVRSLKSPDSIPVEVDMPFEVVLDGNSSLLSAIFCNLIRNANAYSRATRINIRARKSADGDAVVSFSDNGIGIPEVHLPHIFERFYRVDKGRSRANGGTGLGLSIVKNAVLFHGGEIVASNLPGSGLRFEITFPRTCKFVGGD